jgi:O-antigen ligase
MLQRFREWLALGLIVLLPLHAFGVTVLTKLIKGPGHAPLSLLASWKEYLLVLILCVALIEVLRNVKLKMNTEKLWKVDVLDALILSLIVLAFLVSILVSPFSILHFALGFKYDFLPLVAFFLARRVSWSEWFKKLAVSSILCVGVIVSVYGILTFFLPDTFFYWLGYSDLHSLYVPGSPIAAFQQIGGSNLHRIQSTFSGPNQFGIWLLLPIAVMLSSSKHGKTYALFDGLRVTLLLVALLLTFCRAAWVAAFIMILIALYPFFKQFITRGRVVGVLLFFLVMMIGAIMLFPSVLGRVSSTRGHIERPIEAVQKMIAHPFGLGLGSAGPATNRFSDSCVMLRPEDDPSWAKPHPELCVFVGDTQVQPTDRTCNCPFLPENWYLQIGVELGWIGFVMYLSLVLCLLRNLRMKNDELRMTNYVDHVPLLIIHKSLFLVFLGVSIAGLFLHSWEDAAVAYVVWLLLAALLPVHQRQTHSIC